VITAKGGGSNEALFGVVVTGRQAPVPDIELIAGPTSATLPTRVLLDWDASFNQLLKSVQHQSMEMIPYEQTGLQRIARFNDETAKGSDFQSLLVVQPADQGENELSRPFLSELADASRETQWQDFSTYSIIVEYQLESDRAHFLIDFDSSVIGREQIEYISQHLTYTISQLSESKLGDQSLRSLADNQWDLNRVWTWNAAVPESTEMCVHDLISQRVCENPSATAISAWDGGLTYEELETLSTNLAHHLSAKAVSKTTIPLVFDKSMFLPVAVLAVMKAGGACVAVDTKQPLDRLSAIIAQANSSFILSSEQNEFLARQLCAKTKDVVIIGPQQLRQVPMHSKLPSVSPNDPLYLVFTSGSTGAPKGVIVTHRNFCSAINHQQKALGFSSTTRVFDFASYAFDVSWGNLLHSLTSVELFAFHRKTNGTMI
jgi:non-ribosomal peptide synthetase component F